MYLHLYFFRTYHFPVKYFLPSDNNLDHHQESNVTSGQACEIQKVMLQFFEYTPVVNKKKNLLVIYIRWVMKFLPLPYTIASLVAFGALHMRRN